MLIGDLYLFKRLMRSYPAIFGECLFVARYHIAYLDRYKDDFIMIIAGYKNDLEERFFRGNQGLRSRFGLWLEIPKYSASELNLIFKKNQDFWVYMLLLQLLRPN